MTFRALSPFGTCERDSHLAGDEIATLATLQRERDMIAVVHRGTDRYDHLGKGCDFEPSDKLRPEQRHAVEAVLDSRDLAINVRGAAGTGKTATLREIDRWSQRRRTRGSRGGSYPECRGRTGKGRLPRCDDGLLLLEDQERQGPHCAGKILIVDEAGMVSGRANAKLAAPRRGSGSQNCLFR